MDQHFAHYIQIFDGDQLMAAVEVEAAGSEVGAGQAHEGQTAAVGAAANRLMHGFHAHSAIGGFGAVDDIHMLFDDRAHVVIGIHQLQFHRAFAVTRVDLRGDTGGQAFAGLKTIAVVVADDVVHHA